MKYDLFYPPPNSQEVMIIISKGPTSGYCPSTLNCQPCSAVLNPLNPCRTWTTFTLLCCWKGYWQGNYTRNLFLKDSICEVLVRNKKITHLGSWWANHKVHKQKDLRPGHLPSQQTIKCFKLDKACRNWGTSCSPHQPADIPLKYSVLVNIPQRVLYLSHSSFLSICFEMSGFQ